MKPRLDPKRDLAGATPETLARALSICQRSFISPNFFISTVRGADANRLSDSQLETIDVVVDHYGKYSGQQLSDLTHSEPPWQQARKDIPPRVRGNSIITLESMAEYYGSFQKA